MNSSWGYSPETLNLGRNLRFLSHVTLKFHVWHWKAIGQHFYAPLSVMHHFVAIGEFKLEWQSGNAQFGSNSEIVFFPCDLENWQMNSKNNKAPLLIYFKLCALFRSHWWIQTGVTVRKRPIWVKIADFFPLWPWNFTITLKNNRAPLCYVKLCGSFRSHPWI